jgi:hypothetical protein
VPFGFQNSSRVPIANCELRIGTTSMSYTNSVQRPLPEAVVGGNKDDHIPTEVDNFIWY